MHLDLSVALAGLIVGFTVGLTGMGGGALMTPILVLLFRVHPLAAVSSDLVASFLMKPVGAAVHLRRGTVNRRLAAWLVAGSVPTAFLGVVLLRLVGRFRHVDDIVQVALGVALLVAAGAIGARALLPARRPASPGRPPIRPVPTLCVGALGGLIVGMTSVGSGSLIIVLLLLLYPTLSTAELVGTDLIQAIPLVGSAAVGHLLLGDFRLGLTASLLLGSVPGVYAGARISSRTASSLVRPVIAVVLLASGLKLVHAGVPATAWIVAAAVVAALAASRAGRRAPRWRGPGAKPAQGPIGATPERVLAGRPEPAAVSVEVGAA